MYRKNVAALIIDQHKKVLGCQLVGFEAWQCVQGGIEDDDADTTSSILREIEEELGSPKDNFRIIYESKSWERYDFIESKNQFKGQEQRWFLVEILNPDHVHLEASHHEFSEVRLMTLNELIASYPNFKRNPFICFLKELRQEGLLVFSPLTKIQVESAEST